MPPARGADDLRQSGVRGAGGSAGVCGCEPAGVRPAGAPRGAFQCRIRRWELRVRGWVSALASSLSGWVWYRQVVSPRACISPTPRVCAAPRVSWPSWGRIPFSRAAGVSLIGCGRVTRAPVGILSGGSARAEARGSFGLTQSHAHHRADLGLGGGAWFYASLPAGFADLAGGFLLGSGTVNTVPHSPQRMRLPRTASGTRSIERQLRLGHMIVTDATDMAAPRGVRCNGDLPRLMSSTEHRSGLIAGEQPAGICCVRSACGIAAAGIYRNRGWACGVAGDGWVRRIRGGVI
jgi:hypothetical protein